jgi:hypothetical protein
MTRSVSTAECIMDLGPADLKAVTQLLPQEQFEELVPCQFDLK